MKFEVEVTMKSSDPVINAVNDLLKKGKEGESKIRKTVSALGLGYSVDTVQELLEAFEEVSGNREIVESMEANAEKSYGELAKNMVGLSIRNSLAMLKLRVVAEKYGIEAVKTRKEAVTVINEVFGSKYEYLDLLDEMVAIEELICQEKNSILRFFLNRRIGKLRNKYDILEKELLGTDF